MNNVLNNILQPYLLVPIIQLIKTYNEPCLQKNCSQKYIGSDRCSNFECFNITCEECGNQCSNMYCKRKTCKECITFKCYQCENRMCLKCGINDCYNCHIIHCSDCMITKDNEHYCKKCYSILYCVNDVLQPYLLNPIIQLIKMFNEPCAQKNCSQKYIGSNICENYVNVDHWYCSKNICAECENQCSNIYCKRKTCKQCTVVKCRQCKAKMCLRCKDLTCRSCHVMHCTNCMIIKKNEYYCKKCYSILFKKKISFALYVSKT